MPCTAPSIAPTIDATVSVSLPDAAAMPIAVSMSSAYSCAIACAALTVFQPAVSTSRRCWGSRSPRTRSRWADFQAAIMIGSVISGGNSVFKRPVYNPSCAISAIVWEEATALGSGRESRACIPANAKTNARSGKSPLTCARMAAPLPPRYGLSPSNGAAPACAAPSIARHAPPGPPSQNIFESGRSSRPSAAHSRR